MLPNSSAPNSWAVVKRTMLPCVFVGVRNSAGMPIPSALREAHPNARREENDGEDHTMTGSSQKSWKGALLLATTVIGCFLTTSVHAGELPTARVTQRAHLPGETVELSLENATPGQIVWLYVAGVPGAFDNGVGVFLGLVPASGSLTLSANLGCDVPDLFVQYGVISIDGLTLTNEVSVLLVDDSSCGPAGQGCSVEQWAGSAEWPVPYSPTQLYAEASFVDLFPGMTMREVLETTKHRRSVDLWGGERRGAVERREQCGEL